MKRVSTVDLEKRNDLHLTSTGIGHALREFPYTIPPVQVGEYATLLDLFYAHDP